LCPLVKFWPGPGQAAPSPSRGPSTSSTQPSGKQPQQSTEDKVSERENYKDDNIVKHVQSVYLTLKNIKSDNMKFFLQKFKHFNKMKNSRNYNKLITLK
jgi:hypothetical protein